MHYEWNAGAKDSSKQTLIAKRGQMVDPSDDFTKVFTLYQFTKLKYILFLLQTD